MLALKLIFKGPQGAQIDWFALFLLLSLLAYVASYSCKDSEAYSKVRHPDEARDRVFSRKYGEKYYCFMNGRRAGCIPNAHDRRRCAVNPYVFPYGSEIPIHLSLTDDVEDTEYRYISTVSEFRNNTPEIYVLARVESSIPAEWASCKLSIYQVFQASASPRSSLIPEFSQECSQIDLNIEDMAVSFIPPYVVLYRDISKDLEYMAIENKIFIKEGRKLRQLLEIDEDIIAVEICFPYVCYQTVSNPILRTRAYDCEHLEGDCITCAQFKELNCLCNKEHKCITNNPQPNDQALKEAEIIRLEKEKEKIQEEILYLNHEIRIKNISIQKHHEEQNCKQKYKELLQVFNETKQELKGKESQLSALTQHLKELKPPPTLVPPPTQQSILAHIGIFFLIFCCGAAIGAFLMYKYVPRFNNNGILY